MSYVFIIISYISLLLFIGARFFFYKFENYKEKQNLYKNVIALKTIYETSKQLAYKKTFQENINTFLINNISLLDDKKFEEAQKKFINYTINLCGPNVISDLEKLHGSTDALVYDMFYSFVVRLNEEESIQFKNPNNKEETEKDFENNNIPIFANTLAEKTRDEFENNN